MPYDADDRPDASGPDPSGSPSQRPITGGDAFDADEGFAVADRAPAAMLVSPDASQLVEAIDRRDPHAAMAWLDAAQADDAVHDIAALSENRRSELLALLPAEQAAEVVLILPEQQAAEALSDAAAPTAAGILTELSSDERADFVKALPAERAEAVLAELEPEVAASVRSLAAYDEDTAGAWMLTEYLVFRDTATVREVLADLNENAERYAKYDIQYTYITDGAGRLVGVLPLRRLLLAARSAPVVNLMVREPVTVSDTMPLDELGGVFREHAFMGLPVVDRNGRLIGVVKRSDMVQAQIEEADDLYRQSQGIVGGEELRSMPLLLRSRRRLAWLSVNILLNIAAASVIAVHQDTLEAVIALAVFLPIISDMSGCSGNQAVAVTMRELTLGVTRPRDTLRVLFKEASVGVINGLLLGLLIGTVALLWKDNVYLGLVVGSALALNTVVAVCIGGSVPLVLKAFKADPALASGPILTTVTDMCGFFLVLTFASAMLVHLT
jgi:magnesium transporter